MANFVFNVLFLRKNLYNVKSLAVGVRNIWYMIIILIETITPSTGHLPRSKPYWKHPTCTIDFPLPAYLGGRHTYCASLTTEET